MERDILTQLPLLLVVNAMEDGNGDKPRSCLEHLPNVSDPSGERQSIGYWLESAVVKIQGAK